MSYIALVTGHFDEFAHFYGELLGFPTVEQWDRPNARGVRFDAGGMRLEILDNEREQHPLELGETSDKVHVVVELEDIDTAAASIAVAAPPIKDTSWGARLFQIRDPDRVPITFLQWTRTEGEE